MKNYRLIKLLLVAIFFLSQNSFGQDRWWQREIPSPSANQIINPVYLSKRREMEGLLDRMRDMARERNNSAKLGQTDAVKNADDFLQFQGKKMNMLENELAKIPIYITNPDINPTNINIQNANQQNIQNVITTSSYSDGFNENKSSSNSYLLTIYKIKNYNKNNFKNDFDRNSESLNLFNEIKNRIDEIVYHEYKEITYSSLDIDKLEAKIRVYETFMNNWGKSIGTDEAQKEIDGLRKTIEDNIIKDNKDRLRKEEEKNLSELKEKTDVLIRYHFYGDLEPIIQVFNGYRCFAYILSINLSVFDEFQLVKDDPLLVDNVMFCGKPPTVKNLFSKGYSCNNRVREIEISLKNYVLSNIHLKKSIIFRFNYNIGGYNYERSQTILEKNFQIESIKVNPKRKTYVDLDFYLNGISINDIKYKITYD